MHKTYCYHEHFMYVEIIDGVLLDDDLDEITNETKFTVD